MRHGVKKIKFTEGQDSHQALMRKLVLGFIKHGKADITITRAKALKSVMDRLTSKAIRGTSADKVMLQKYLVQKPAIKTMLEDVAPVMKNRVGGYVTMQKLGVRQGDFAEMARIEWVEKIVIAEEVKPVDGKVEKKPAAKKPTKKVTSSTSSAS